MRSTKSTSGEDERCEARSEPISRAKPRSMATTNGAIIIYLSKTRNKYYEPLKRDRQTPNMDILAMVTRPTVNQEQSYQHTRPTVNQEQPYQRPSSC